MRATYVATSGSPSFRLTSFSTGQYVASRGLGMRVVERPSLARRARCVALSHEKCYRMRSLPHVKCYPRAERVTMKDVTQSVVAAAALS